MKWYKIGTRFLGEWYKKKVAKSLNLRFRLCYVVISKYTTVTKYYTHRRVSSTGTSVSA